ncbi:FUSC family protein [Micromonospora sp. NPDC005161]
MAAQAGVAAVLAGFIARDVLDNPQPLFAPAVAVGTIASAIGNRVRRAAELVAGVVVGVVVGHWLIRVIGVGPVKTGVVVALAISAAVLFRGGGAALAQAGSTALLLATVADGATLAVPRTEAALVGGVTAIAVALIMPLNPLRVIRRAGGPTTDLFARELTTAARALAHRDLQQAENALQGYTPADAKRQNLNEMVAAAREVAVLSPWRRRQLNMVRRYQHAGEQLEHTYTSGREMVTWAGATIRAGEPVPAGLPASIEHVGQALRLMHRDFLAGREPEPTRARALQAIKEVNDACAHGIEFSGTVVVSRVRAAVSELLQASGLPKAEANEQAGLKADV